MLSETGTSAAVLFPGQGSQEKGMGRDVAERYPEAMELWKLAEVVSGSPLREIYWDGEDQAMAETRFLQPALLVTGYNLWSCASSWLRPSSFAGHSVGEYTALAAAGVLDIREAIELISLRGRLMSEAGKDQSGQMAAILKLAQAEVEEIVSRACAESGQELCVANFNSPAQLVISGAEEALDCALELCREKKGRGVRLPVSGAFHSGLMEEASRELARMMDRYDWKDAAVPVHLNVTSRPEDRAEQILATMKLQMRSPVLWTQLVEDQLGRGVQTWLEFGPKGVLTKLVRHILKETPGDWRAESVDSLEALEQLRNRA
jgi:[acyl-carrier-protein] S-malonyltransferase